MRFARVLLTMLAVLLPVATIAVAESHDNASRLDAEDLIGEWWGIWNEQGSEWTI